MIRTCEACDTREGDMVEDVDRPREATLRAERQLVRNAKGKSWYVC
jgi:hypothetical protein